MALVDARHDGGGRLPGGDLLGQVGPGHDDDALGLDARDLGDDLAHPLVVPSSTPFIRRHQRGAVAGSAEPQPARLARSVCDGTASTTMSAPSAASAGSVVARDAGRQRDAGQVVLVAAVVDLVDHLLRAVPTSARTCRRRPAPRRRPCPSCRCRYDASDARSCGAPRRGWGLPVVRCAVGARVAARDRRLGAAQLLELGGDRLHDRGRSPRAARLGGDGRPCRSPRSTGGPGAHRASSCGGSSRSRLP